MSNYIYLKNLVYTQTEKECHTADVYLPKSGEDFPVVIMVHGGAFQAGSKEMYGAWGPYLASQGIAAVSINYTLATPTKPSYPTLLQDMEDAISFVVENAYEWKIEPRKMGFMGDSAGAYLGTMAAFANERSSAKICFVVCAYGVMDIADWAHYTNATRTDFVINKMFGQDPFSGAELYKSACPMHLIDEAVRNPLFNTKFFMTWGDKDDVVEPENQTLAFIKKLEKHNIPHEKLLVPGQGHFWFTKNDFAPGHDFTPLMKDEVAPKVITFINKAVE